MVNINLAQTLNELLPPFSSIPLLNWVDTDAAFILWEAFNVTYSSLNKGFLYESEAITHLLYPISLMLYVETP